MWISSEVELKKYFAQVTEEMHDLKYKNFYSSTQYGMTALEVVQTHWMTVTETSRWKKLHSVFNLSPYSLQSPVSQSGTWGTSASNLPEARDKNKSCEITMFL